MASFSHLDWHVKIFAEDLIITLDVYQSFKTMMTGCLVAELGHTRRKNCNCYFQKWSKEVSLTKKSTIKYFLLFILWNSTVMISISILIVINTFIIFSLEYHSLSDVQPNIHDSEKLIQHSKNSKQFCFHFSVCNTIQ